MMSHCILLIQKTSDKATRTYCEFECVNDMLDGVCKMFEERLKSHNPSLTTIAYDIWELFDFIDSLRDMGALVLMKSDAQYAPKPKEWIKARLYTLLKTEAAKNSK